MTNAIVTLKIMPESPESDLDSIRDESLKFIEDFAGKGDTKVEQEPIAFGLKALKIIFIMDESIGSTDALEEKIAKLDHVNSVDVIDVRRAVG